MTDADKSLEKTGVWDGEAETPMTADDIVVAAIEVLPGGGLRRYDVKTGATLGEVSREEMDAWYAADRNDSPRS